MTAPAMWGVGAWAIGGLAALAVAAFAPVVESTQPDLVRRPPPPSAVLRSFPADSLARLTVSRDVFRSTRRPSSVAYDPQRAVAPVESNQPPKPALALVGIVAAPEPSAVIEGIPGIEGSRVMRVGDVVSGFRVKRIGGDHVVIVGMDTTWVLKVREPWK